VARCAQCHAEDGRGNIGPNLTDHYWIHGQGKLLDIYEVVHDGVPAKGMPAWSRQLSPAELAKVTAFVGSIRGKNLPGKGPEGAKVDAPGAAEPAAAEEPAAEPVAAEEPVTGEPAGPELPEGPTDG
jgi:cytochrome c oxidase cbb3-type subunit III